MNSNFVKKNTAISIELEARKCPVCSKQFRVLPSSVQEMCSDSCARSVVKGNGEDTRFGIRRNRATTLSLDEMEEMAFAAQEKKNKTKSVAEIKPRKLELEAVKVEKKELSVDDKWSSYVQRASQLVSRMAKCRVEICDIALEACEINCGGGAHWSGFDGVYTLKKFAEDVGMSAKTLSNWVRIRRFSLMLDDFDADRDWQAMGLAAGKLKLTDSPSKVKKEFEKWRNKKNEFNQSRYILQGLRRVRSLVHFLENKYESSNEDVEALTELSSKCQKIVKIVRGMSCE